MNALAQAKPCVRNELLDRRAQDGHFLPFDMCRGASGKPTLRNDGGRLGVGCTANPVCTLQVPVRRITSHVVYGRNAETAIRQDGDLRIRLPQCGSSVVGLPC